MNNQNAYVQCKKGGGGVVGYEVVPLADAAFLPPVVAVAAPFLPDGAYIAGGAIADHIAGIHPKDIDIFFRDAEAMFRTIELFAQPPYGFPLTNYKLSKCEKQNRFVEYAAEGNPIVVQMIAGNQWWEDLPKLLNDFDFTACQFGVTNKAAMYNPVSLGHTKDRKLVLNNVQPNLHRFLKRLMRYAAKGYTADNDTLDLAIKHIKDTKRQEEAADFDKWFEQNAEPF